MKIKYATIIVKDMEESIRFYTEVMGFKIDSQYDLGSNGTITLLKSEGEAMLELIRSPLDEPGLFSIGIEVEDLKAKIKELKSKGAKVIMEPTPITVGLLAFIEDPNGARIALIQHH
ncbi:MAG TPA: VOC family protein [Methanothermobacter sp.]|jgi:lactoylglutathione lyase|uniref:Glyoxalase n=1 Tax=Methanothermobacter tenebrarum TaxID=680118 RepID=A0ABM7YF21_9EURY|nr:VOC family protein [Methanothermobacter tenebrarum]MDI6882556.1 VOC family protein [Methanothermobacter sp.]MDX9694109.1 VOC family protein [Methanothermobacter sp.]BDH79923.1 glyoxalase [Methanothermobacter tenebrarum]HHW16864.1 VOC family protein [Methanothermobacter sp.]HOQ20682.1 VOC family protein [Methanothermobacter sp.]